ncbi:MAG: rod-binding protein [Armatimonadota bacterium]|nr:rod-binding protein [Armatimonadota bacterium]MDR7438857.1 rod-binding protein [Armatimonadota bacterium]MDR7562398.1 rod-binding protein [Armatimonadota bacterium]MDR7568667.1 rod-binding protein [Armatimonadota bacterium]MDR7601478.1 rod-binding protein [Armatimonadota bacterium]
MIRVEATRAGAESAELLRLRRVTQEFEAVLLTQMLRTMRRAAESLGSHASFAGRSTWQELLDESFALAVARSGGLGLARVLEEALGRR